MKKLLLACALAITPFAVQADAIASLKQFVGQTRSMKAEFTQVVSGRQTQTASGSLELSRPGKFRWTYSQPYPQLIVGDGQRLWVYDSDLAQVTSKKLDDALLGDEEKWLTLAEQIEAEEA